GYSPALEKADLCGQLLLGRRSLDRTSGLRAWVTTQDTPSSGFAHGASGIAHALLRLYGATAAKPYRDAALEAFAFERSLRQADSGRWPGWRHQPESASRFTSWCQGAPGISLGRLTALPYLPADSESDVVNDLRHALRATAEGKSPDVDTICCGYFGRIDILLEAGERLGNVSLGRHARRLAELRLERAETEGFHKAVSPEPTPLLGGFWQGESGIGYVLLRLADPGSLPCVLALS
ncbi:MAG: lanthionine synthetase LanC family protein, partial [Acidobacteriota bacterium]